MILPNLSSLRDISQLTTVIFVSLYHSLCLYLHYNIIYHHLGVNAVIYLVICLSLPHGPEFLIICCGSASSSVVHSLQRTADL
jgi:hypothetical protein